MKRTACAVLVALAAALASMADDPRAPLADSKLQLQQLQKDTNAAKTGAGDSSLKGAFPDLNTTLQGREALPATSLAPNQNQKERDRKQEAKKNWLVDGYDRLDPKSTNGKPADTIAAAGTDADDKDKEPESGDPEFLIKLYEKQAKPSETAAARDKQAGEKITHSVPADPLAPFLQGWLANSPVRDVAISTTPKNDGDGGVATPAASVAPGSVSAPIGAIPTAVTAPGAAPDNPFLLSLTLPAATAPSLFTAAPPTPDNVDAFTSVSLAKPTLVGPTDSLVPAARSDLRKPPTTPADDDKKYFPQLKRF